MRVTAVCARVLIALSTMAAEIEGIKASALLVFRTQEDSAQVLATYPVEMP